MNPLIVEMMIKERHREMLQEAKRQRLVALYEARYLPRRAKLLIGLGDLLIQLGEKLKHRYQHETALSPNFS